MARLASELVPNLFPVMSVRAYPAEANNLALAVPGGEARRATGNPGEGERGEGGYEHWEAWFADCHLLWFPAGTS